MLHDDFSVHPGQVLRNQLRGRSVFELAAVVGIEAKQLQRILDEQLDITRDMSVKLAQAFGTTAEFWWQMQVNYNRCKESRRWEE